MILPSSEARRIGRFSDPEFCSDHHLLSSRIAVACIPIQPEPMCCELLVPAMDSKGCVCKLMNDGTELDNFLMKYTSCGGQHPEFLEEAQNCSLVLPNEAAPMPAVPEIAPTQEVPEVVVLARKSKNVISLQWLWLLLLFVVLGGLLFCIVCELKKKREAGRVRPQSQDVQLTERVTVHPRQTADDMIRNQHVEIPVIEELPFLGPTEAGRVRPQSQDVQLTDRVTVHPRQTADDMIRNQHVEIPVIEELPFLGPNEAGRVRPQSQDVQLTDSVTMRPRQTADGMIRNQHVEIPVIEELPFLGPMTRSRFVAMKDKAVGTKESTSD